MGGGGGVRGVPGQFFDSRILDGFLATLILDGFLVTWILERVLTVGVPGQFCHSRIFRLTFPQNDLGNLDLRIFPSYYIFSRSPIVSDLYYYTRICDWHAVYSV